jgi:hypothetical protein
MRRLLTAGDGLQMQLTILSDRSYTQLAALKFVLPARTRQ